MKFPKTEDKQLLSYKGIFIKVFNISEIRNLFNFCMDMGIIASFSYSEDTIKYVFQTYYKPGVPPVRYLCVVGLLEKKPCLTHYPLASFSKECKDEYLTVKEFIKVYQDFLPARNAYLNGDDSLIEFEDMYLNGED